MTKTRQIGPAPLPLQRPSSVILLVVAAPDAIAATNSAVPPARHPGKRSTRRRKPGQTRTEPQIVGVHMDDFMASIIKVFCMHI